MDARNGGRKPAIAIQEVPLEWCLQPGVKLEFRHLPDGHVVTAAEVEAERKRIGHTLTPLEIVVVNTRAGSQYGAVDRLWRVPRHGFARLAVTAGRHATGSAPLTAPSARGRAAQRRQPLGLRR